MRKSVFTLLTIILGIFLWSAAPSAPALDDPDKVVVQQKVDDYESAIGDDQGVVVEESADAKALADDAVANPDPEYPCLPGFPGYPDCLDDSVAGSGDNVEGQADPHGYDTFARNRSPG